MQHIPTRTLRAAIAALFVPLAFASMALPETAFAAPAALQASVVKPNAAFDAWADKFARDWVRLNPQFATATQYFSGAEQDALDRQLTPYTEAQEDRQLALARAGVKKLDQFLACPLDPAQRISALTMRWQLDSEVAGAPFRDHSFVFAQFGGAHVELVNFMTQAHPLRRAADVDSYLARLAQVSTRIDEAIVRGRHAAKRSLLPPRFILERAQAQVDAFLAPPAVGNVLVTSLEQRTADMPGLTPQARAVAIAKATRIVEQSIRPAYGRVKAFMAEIYPATTSTAGLSSLPDGKAAYARALAKFTNSTLTPDEVHAIGLREVARIEGEMDKHLRSLGYNDGSIEQRMKQLDATFQPKGEGDPRPALLARYTEMVRDAERRSDALFDLKPKAPIDVRREPPLTEPAASAHYTMPAPDGSRPGIFWVPMRGPTFDTIRMRSLAYHEAVPGHHFQLAIQQEQQGLPKYRAARIFGGGSAHAEGWGLYAERLAVEQGWYDGDVPGLLGALGSELFRARRLVVDTGIHAKRWTREQGIAYGIGAQEVERYVAWPGQANAYMIGMLRILDMREKARAALGPKFSLPAFHDVVLRTGSVPLDVLQQAVDAWVAGQLKA